MELPVGPAGRSLLSYRTIEPIAILADMVIVLIASLALGVLSVGWGGRAAVIALGVAPILCGLFVPTAKLAGLYRPSALLSGGSPIHHVMLLWCLAILMLGFCYSTLEPGAALPIDAGIALTLIGLLGLVAHRGCWRLVARNGLAKASAPGRTALLIHQGNLLADTDLLPDLQRFGIRIEHRVNLGNPDDDETLVHQRIDMAVAIAQSLRVDEILVSADIGQWSWIEPHLPRLRQLPLPVSLIARDWMSGIVSRPTHILGTTALVEIQQPPLSFPERVAKRALDLTGALVGLLLLWPVLSVVALLIVLDSPGPVLFRQTRIGFNGRPFSIYKFRTMNVLEDGSDVTQATCEDERVTAFGRWLRRTSIDELPQLFNVLKGEMSIVGPRPHAVSHDNEFSQLIAEYALRRRMKPGITGWAQVLGYRGGTPHIELISRRVHMDMLYIEKWGIWLDLAIIARTVVAVIRGHNAY